MQFCAVVVAVLHLIQTGHFGFYCRQEYFVFGQLFEENAELLELAQGLLAVLVKLKLKVI